MKDRAFRPAVDAGKGLKAMESAGGYTKMFLYSRQLPEDSRRLAFWSSDVTVIQIGT
jgi:hypothetical protein